MLDFFVSGEAMFAGKAFPTATNGGPLARCSRIYDFIFLATAFRTSHSFDTLLNGADPHTIQRIGPEANKIPKVWEILRGTDSGVKGVRPEALAVSSDQSQAATVGIVGCAGCSGFAVCCGSEPRSVHGVERKPNSRLFRPVFGQAREYCR